jgi:hypothetical protein
MTRGVVEQSTVHRDVRLASVRTDAGPVVIVRLDDDLAAGSAVSLHREDLAIVARGTAAARDDA